MQTAYKKISEAKNLRGKRVLLRLDWNVPIIGDEVRDDFRIKRSIPTIQFLRNAGAKVIVISHLESEITDSLEKIAEYVSKFAVIKSFVTETMDAKAIINTMDEGEVIILENLRRNPGEKANAQSYAQELASLADIFVSDAFAVLHREHASVVSVPKILPSYAGLLLSEEIEQLSKAFNPTHPFVFILGGAKFDTKLPLIEKFIDIADTVFIGGALANDIFKEKGYEVGMSLVSKTRVNLRLIAKSPKVMIPEDVVVADEMTKEVRTPDKVGISEKILDAGPQTVSMLADHLSEASFVLWNGPVGDYEHGFSGGTEGIAHAIAESRAMSIIGGGDTIAVVAKEGLLDKFSFVSTGGGAMLEFLAKGTLPGIEALK
jgi:phosphoglycerate kinase